MRKKAIKQEASKKVKQEFDINNCPFCNSSAKISENPWGAYVECKNSKCNAVGPSFLGATVGQAIKLWNSRK